MNNSTQQFNVPLCSPSRWLHLTLGQDWAQVTCWQFLWGDKNRHVLNTVNLPHFTFVTDDSGASTVRQSFLKEHPTGHRPHSVEAPVVPLSSKCWVSPSWEVDDPLRLGSLDHSKDLNIQPLNIFLVSPSPNLGSTGYPKWGYNIKKIPPLPEQIGPCQEAPETSHPFFLYFMEHAQWHAVTCSDMRSLTRFLRGGAHRLKMSWVILSVPSSGLWFHPIEIAIVWRWIIHFQTRPCFFDPRDSLTMSMS